MEWVTSLGVWQYPCLRAKMARSAELSELSPEFSTARTNVFFIYSKVCFECVIEIQLYSKANFITKNIPCDIRECLLCRKVTVQVLKCTHAVISNTAGDFLINYLNIRRNLILQTCQRHL